MKEKRINWTADQQSAINLPTNLLVSAAAGSGKTAVLTARIVRLVSEGCDIEHILVVTFTKAAAAEMKKRISKGLAELADETSDTVLQKRLREQAQKAEHANISTIHSFCTRVLKRHFHEAGLDPSFRAADETQTAILRVEAMEELLEERYDSGSPEFLELVSLLDTEEKLVSLLFELYGFMAAFPEPESFLWHSIENFSRDEKALAESEEYLWLAEYSAESIVQAANRLQKLCCFQEPVKQRHQLDDELSRVRALRLFKGFDEYREALSVLHFDTLRLPKDFDGDLKERIKCVRQEMKDLIKQHRSWFKRSLAEEAAVLQTLYPAMKELQRLIWDFDAKFALKKAEAGIIDYADMEHLTLRVLKVPDIAREYREKFGFIFIDEFQDSNQVQESIINAVKRKENVFMVGDVKQSIYRFRLAEPGIFLNKSEEYKQSEKGTKLDLNRNYRSAGNVIHTVNTVFSKIMHIGTCDIEYDESAKLVMGRELEEQSGIVQLHILEKEREDSDENAENTEEDTEPGSDAQGKDKDEDDEDDVQALSDTQAEALLAARQIRELTDETNDHLIYDSEKQCFRNYRYSDFAVLLRANKTAEVWTQVLSMEGIPSFAQVNGSYFAAIEVNTMMDLLRIIDNKRQDIPLISVLYSPIGGFDAGELALLRADAGEESVYDSLVRFSTQDTELGRKVNKFLQTLTHQKEKAELYSVEQLIGTLLDETGYYTYVGAIEGGKRRQANLDALVTRAHEYERNAKRGLWSFIRFMDNAKKTESFGEAQISAADVVNIFTVHKSKGLEFPVVILAGLGSGFGKSKNSTHKEWGFGLCFYKDHMIRKTMNLRAIKERTKRADLAEEMRILYVGMTRAREHLILIGTAKNIKNSVDRFRGGMSNSDILNAGCFLDWVIGALLQVPDGDPLRKAAGITLNPGENEERIRIHLHSQKSGDLSGAKMNREDFEAWEIQALKADISELEKRFSWKYPYQEAIGIPGKTSVSALSRTGAVIVEAPEFARPHSMSAADKGTAAHRLMQFISIKAHTAATVKAELQKLLEQGFMNPEQASAVDIGSVVRFFDSPLGRRLCASGRIERELEFNHSKPASELFDTASDDRILLQGVIDCAFWEKDGWVLIDYKTDRVQIGETPEQTAEKHRLQVELYKKALSELSGMPVKEAYIHLLRVGESVRI